MLSKVAREVGCWIIGGSMPEKAAGQADDDPRTWNTLTVWNDQGTSEKRRVSYNLGDLVGKYRKMHMYDVDIPGEGGITMKESSVITPGNDILIVDMRKPLIPCRLLNGGSIRNDRSSNMLRYPIPSSAGRNVAGEQRHLRISPAICIQHHDWTFGMGDTAKGESNRQSDFRRNVLASAQRGG